MQAGCYISKYTQSSKSKARIKYYDILATEKWVEYMLDKHDVNKILMVSDFATKMDLLEVLQVLERKIDYMYRHPNFEFHRATFLFNRLKTQPKVAESATPKKVAKKARQKR